MEPQKQESIQPDQPDDDADQEADQPPPQQPPPLLDNNALSLVAQPLASAVARVAASHPLSLPLDHLNDFNVDLTWATPDIDSLFLNDTQYLQLGDDQSSPTPSSLPPTPLPQPSTSPQNDSSPPLRRSRPRPNQPPPEQNPIPIAPRIVSKSASPTPPSTQPQSAPLYTKPQKSTPALQSPHPSPASVSLDTTVPQNTTNTVPHFPLAASHPSMTSVIPVMNMMYPLQHQQSIFQPSPPVLPSTESNTSHPQSSHPSVPSNQTDANNTRLPHSQPSTSASQNSSHHRPVAQQHFISPTMQVIPQGVVPYDPTIMPYVRMAYAAAAAGYPQRLIPPIPSTSTNIPSTMLNHFGPNRAQSAQHNNSKTIPATPPHPSTVNHTTQQPSRPHSKPSATPVLVHDSGAQVLVPQQKAARLERHPVLGRLQLKSSSKPQDAATSSAIRFVSDTQTTSGETQQKPFPASTPAPPTVSKHVSAPIVSRDDAQRQQKKRLVWTPELHDRFVKAINAVGLSQAVPKTLVTIMNVEGLTTEHVKSHLQKYRNSLRKEAADEERDRSRGAAPSVGPHNIKLGTPGASGAAVIRSVAIVTPSGSGANQNGRPDGTTMTNSGATQQLPILSSRINAFGGQMQRVRTLDAKVSTQATKPVSAPQADQAVMGSDKGGGRSPSPRLGSMHNPKQGGDVKGSESGTGVVAQPSQAASTTMEPSNGKGMEVDTNNALDGETGKNVGQGSVEGGNSSGGVASYETEDAMDVSPKAGDNSQIGQDLAGDEVKQTEKDGNAGAANQSNRDSELGVIKEETQQLQLQVQMMIYRTIALEKKWEEHHSERLNEEASGTGDASKRSTGGDGKRSGGENGEFEMKDEETGSDNKAESGDRDEKKENDIVGEVKEESEEQRECNGEEDKDKDGTKKRRCPSGSGENHHSEVKALLSEEMGLHKRIADKLAMIDTFGKRMRREGEEMVEKKKAE